MSEHQSPKHHEIPTESEKFRHELNLLKTNDQIVTMQLHGDSTALGETTEPIAEAVNLGSQTVQSLIGIIRAGDELFGIVKAEITDSNQTSGYLLTKFGDEQRATVVSKITESESLVVGREHQDGLNAMTSRNHFSIQFGPKGIEVQDLGSSNGTEVYAHGGIVHDKALTMSGMRRLLGRGANNDKAHSELPGQDFKLWAPESAQVKQLIEHAHPEYDRIESALSERLLSDHGPQAEGALGLFERAKKIISENTELSGLVEEIVVHETAGGVPLPQVYGKYTAGAQEEKLSQLLYYLERSPEVANAIISGNVIGFHTSNSASLLGVLKNGLMSSAELRKNNMVIASGEKTFSAKGGQNTISFADWRRPQTIKYYAQGNNQPLDTEMLRETIAELRVAGEESRRNWGEDHPYVYNTEHNIEDLQQVIELLTESPDSDEAKFVTANFPVAYGISAEGLESYATTYDRPKTTEEATKPYIVERVKSDVAGEFMVYGARMPADNLKVIAVPDDKVEMVRKLADKLGSEVEVVPIEDLVSIQDQYDKMTNKFVEPHDKNVFI